MDVKNTHSVTKTEISVFGRQALDAERRRSPSLADKGNDIQRNISSKLRLFADDSLLYRQITEPEDEEILQSDINKLLEWAKLWQMNFNIAKCHTLRIRRSIRGSKDQTLPVRKYYMEGELLSDVEHHPYIGVELDSSLSWDLHLANTRSKSIRVLNNDQAKLYYWHEHEY